MAEQTKAEREAAQREAARAKAEEKKIADYLAKGQERPPNDMITAQPEPSDDAQEPAVADEAPAVAALAAKPASKPKPAPHAAPWDDAHPQVQVNFTTRLSQRTHKRLTWLADNLPRQSIQKLVHASIDRYVDELIAEHYKP